MSTGADAKTMPGTAEFVANHERIFGDTGPKRGIWVMRCEPCDGVTLPEGTTRYNCPKCGGKEVCGSIDLNAAPPLPAEAVNAPILSGRFYENTVAIDGKTDIGSREKYREYLKREGVTNASDFSKGWYEKQRQAKAEASFKGTRETVARTLYERWKP